MGIDLVAKAERIAKKGVDLRTMIVNFECELERPLTADEAAAVTDAYRAAGGTRAARDRAADQAAADQARAGR